MSKDVITSLPPSPDDERRQRVVKYSIMMAIRVLCVVALIWARGWWIVVFAVAAVVLPYFAVLIANIASPRRGSKIVSPRELAASPDTPGGGAHR